ncbi:hypothetical protein SAMN05443144_101291 [Fodinibius roseus]|uniref:Uncharacterized protein n=1 Tax=Fodinibius roseus TaxID=1194090 RepID=A0A1M4TGW0_9BACT|nr:hypothetical protein [Fodinibius roseus]SHE43691.1 hypothetical protein SAMN05443144_101291 [Fodinibius roseus]
MTYKNHVKTVLKIIAAITIISGLVQAVNPALVLYIIDGAATPASTHFFGIVGLFMVLFGGLLYHALGATRHQPVAVFWCGFQKFGAAAAVGLGVSRDIFSWLALGVAGFDLVSGFLIMIYWYSIKER